MILRNTGFYEVIFVGTLTKRLAEWKGLWVFEEKIYLDSDFSFISNDPYNAKTDCEGHPLCDCGLCVETWNDIAKKRQETPKEVRQT